MIDDPGLMSKALSWISVPVTGLVGLLGFHYKKLNTKVDRMDEDISDLREKTAVSSTDIEYIKESCDMIHARLLRIETKLEK